MRNLPKEIKDMLTQISIETSMPYDVVESIYCHEFKFVTKQMEKGIKGKPETYENILLKHFGSFIANTKQINKITYDIKKKAERTKV